MKYDSQSDAMRSPFSRKLPVRVPAAQVPNGAACDGFHVAAHAYRQLVQQLHAARCSRLTAVLLGTEHRGTTPIALSRQVRVCSNMAGMFPDTEHC
jgi:hypothetical protein